ncbi:MAG: DUF421 domain-containing protein [Thermoleophilia bacterium]
MSGKRAGRGFSFFASHLRCVWHDVFHLGVPFAEKVVRSILVYLFLIAALRLVGKRELGQANTLDLVVLLLVANAVQNGIIGNDLSVTGAVVGAAVLFVINELLARIAYVFPSVSQILEGEPIILIEHGRPNRRALFRAGISLSELRAIARRQGFSDLGQVHTAILETNGVVSMFAKDEPHLYHPAEPGGLRIGKRRSRS